MIDVYLSAFRNDYFGSFCFLSEIVTDDERRRWLRARFLRFMSRPENRNFKVTEVSTGKIVAWARWYFPYKFSEEEKLERDREEQEKERARAEGTLQEWPLGANVELCNFKFGELARLMKKYVDLEDMYALSLLSTDPSYQRKGLATMLLSHVLSLADAEGRKTYVESTPTGYPLYKKFGFRDIDLLRVDLSKWGGKEPGINTIMLRQPRPLGK